MKIILTTESELKDLIETTTHKVLPTVIREAARKEWLTSDDVMDYLQCNRLYHKKERTSNGSVHECAKIVS